jgi:hypothetical protein
MNKKQKLIDAQLRKNPLVQAAAIAHLAVYLEYTRDEDEDGYEAAEKGGEVLARCCSLMGLRSDEGKLTPKQEALDDAVTDAILELSTKMEAALIKARLLRSDWAEARESQRKAA